MASEGDRRAGPEVAARRSKILDAGGDARSVGIALASTVCFFVLIGFAITHAPGWHEVRRTFFDWGEFHRSLPEISRAFLLNVKIFCIAEVLILVVLVLSVLQAAATGARPFATRLRGPVLAVALLSLAAVCARVEGPEFLARFAAVGLVAGLCAAVGTLPYMHEFDADERTATSPIPLASA